MKPTHGGRRKPSKLPTDFTEQDEQAMAIKDRLEYLRGEIENERISYGEISELQDLAEHIDPSDTLLLRWAGVPEFPDAD